MKSFAEFIAEENGLSKINLPAINKEVVNRQAKKRNNDVPPTGFSISQLARERARQNNPNKRLDIRAERELA